MFSSSYCLPEICMKRVTSADNLSEERSTHSDSTDEVIDLKGDQFGDKKAEAEELKLSSVDMWALGMTTAIGGHYFPWNAGLGAGFGSYLIATVLISTAYFCLILCISELSSALPFAGGAYGIARVTLGIFPGYLVACCDSYKSVLYVSAASFALGEEITRVTHGPRSYEALYWFLFYIISISIQAWGGKYMWRLNFILAILCTAILLIYILGSIKFANFMEYAQLDDQSTGSDEYFQGGMYEFMHILPLPCWFFVGVQSINVACGQLRNPKRDVPRGCVAAVSTVMVTSISVLFITCSLPPSISFLKERLRPLTTGFSLMFDVSRDYSTMFSVPATITSGFGFMYFYSQQLSSMAHSGMLNSWVGKEWPRRKTPVAALVIGALIGYGVNRIRYYVVPSRQYFYNIGMLGALATYLSIFASFVMFRLYFPSIKREFISPLGIAGAVYGFIVFTFAFVSICGFQEDQTAIIAFGAIIVVASIYYFLVVKDRQVFSEEEKTVLFKAYLVKNNKARNIRIKKGAGARQQATAYRQSTSVSAGAGASAGAHAGAGALAHLDLERMEAQAGPGGERAKPGSYIPLSPLSGSCADHCSERTRSYNDLLPQLQQPCKHRFPSQEQGATGAGATAQATTSDATAAVTAGTTTTITAIESGLESVNSGENGGSQ